MLLFENDFSPRKYLNISFLIFFFFFKFTGDIKGQHTETLLAGSLAKALCCILGVLIIQKVSSGKYIC